MSYTVYKIGFNNCRKVYVGATGNFDKRKSSHLFNLANNSHPNKDLQLAYAQYGAQNMFFETLQVFDSRDKNGEKFWINKIGIENCFNKNEGSKHSAVNTGLSVVFTAIPDFFEWLQDGKKNGKTYSFMLNSLWEENKRLREKEAAFHQVLK